MATVHPPTDQNLASLHHSSQSIASQAINESLKQEPATQRPAEPEAVSQQPAELEHADPMAVDLPKGQKVSMHPLLTRADNRHQPLVGGAASKMPPVALAHLPDNKPAIWWWSSRQHMSISSGLPH